MNAMERIELIEGTTYGDIADISFLLKAFRVALQMVCGIDRRHGISIEIPSGTTYSRARKEINEVIRKDVIKEFNERMAK